MCIEVITRPYTYLRKIKPDMYIAAALAATISIIDVIIRWDAFYDEVKYLLLNLGFFKFLLAYSTLDSITKCNVRGNSK